MSVKVTWTPGKIIAAVNAAVDVGVTDAAMIAADAAARNFGTEGGGVLGYLAGGVFTEGRANGQKKAGRKIFTASRVGGFPGVRTSHLRNSLAFVAPKDTGTPHRAAFGTNVPYGRYLEFGAVINAKGKMLSIPVHPQAQAATAKGQGPRSFPFLTLIKTKTGALLVKEVGVKRKQTRTGPRTSVVTQSAASGARSEIWYVLVKRAVIPARPWAFRSAKQALPAMRAAFVAGSAKAMQGIPGGAPPAPSGRAAA